MHLTTSNLTFDGQTGEARTPAAVEFALPQGQGSGVVVAYLQQHASSPAGAHMGQGYVH